MKKTISLFLIVVMLLSCVPLALATGSALDVSVESTQAVPDAVVCVRVSIAGNPGIVSAGFHIAFDDNLTLVGATNGDVFPTYISYIPPKQLSTIGEIASSCNFAWSGVDIDSIDVRDGTIMTLAFRVSTQSQPGDTYQITVSSRAGDVIDKDLNSVSYTPATGIITVIDNHSEAQSARLVIDLAESTPGATVFVPIVLENNPGIVSANIHVAFGELLTLVGAENGTVFPDSMSFIPPRQLSTVGEITSSCNFAWSGTDIEVEEIRNGTILTLEFLVSPQALPGESCQITVSSRAGDVIDSNMNVIPLSVCTVSVTISDTVESFTSLDNFDYELTADGISITGYHGDGAEVLIAETYQINGASHSVVNIAESAFEANKTITEVSIPATVKAIGDYAFYDCSHLTKVTVYSTDAIFGELAMGYYYISRKVDGVTEGFTIVGYAGSTAEQYADSEALITFVSLNSGRVPSSVIRTILQAFIRWIQIVFTLIKSLFQRAFK